ncbi:protein-L-isoaspartate O-methyltransferase [Cryphonectria parasitica EP155]|uniref:protein-L-isoaspartate(D-aspartate) O-methyltransferase n=1 Tax=Cryphonectria parasitica (strain ATCC 38755 / EP155) TaxID=660469 RepID=A0A9P5CNK1_CRYP1|nr:protein-L-isoaspartate O-methyltransferase [Cryphonectria parasitica EP155]KAF3764000.1 protein-L-isoaspartate O-methyltransferase [Cryphonectria parasitica EP155]
MAWLSSGSSNENMVQQLCHHGLITDERVKDAFRKVDRGHYAPTAPYADRPQSIGHGATISAPHMHVTAVEDLLPYLVPSDRNPAPRVLDIGSGSGYLTHIFAELVGPQGTVVGLEHIPQLQDLAEANMRKSAEGRQFLDAGQVKLRVGDGRKGWVEPAGEEGRGEGWDVIHVGASAVTMHPELVEQLRAPGRMFIPVNDDDSGGEQHIWRVDKDESGKVEKRKMFAVRYVPLTDGPQSS